MDSRGLALESARILTKKDGVHSITRRIGEVKITDVRLSEMAARCMGRRAGRYISLHGEPHAAGMTALLCRAISQLIPPRGRLFTAGLGNPNITQDSLGAACVRTLTARRGARYSLAAVETDVAAKTGLDTARLVRAAARELKADCVIAIDALSCQDPRYIGKTVQISSSGLVPGSGTGLRSSELSEELLGCPVAAVGVPTVTQLSSITHSSADKNFLVSVPDIDIIIGMWAEVIGGALDLLVGGKGAASS